MGDNEYEELVPNEGAIPDAPADPAPAPAALAKAAASSKVAASKKAAASKKKPKASPAASKPASALSGSSDAINTPGTPGTPGPPTHAIPSVDFKPVELAPLRDDDINLNSNPISGPNESKKGSKKDETVTGSKMKDPKEETSSTLMEDKKKKKSKETKTSSSKSKEPVKISNGPVIGFLASFVLFCVGIGFAVLVAGHKWFGLQAIEAIAH